MHLKILLILCPTIGHKTPYIPDIVQKKKKKNSSLKFRNHALMGYIIQK